MDFLFNLFLTAFLISLSLAAILGRLTENNVNLEEEIVKENVKPKSSYTIVTTDFNAFRKVIYRYYDVMRKCIDYVNIDLWYGKY